LKWRLFLSFSRESFTERLCDYAFKLHLPGSNHSEDRKPEDTKKRMSSQQNRFAEGKNGCS
jgi:hypothetical protein